MEIERELLNHVEQGLLGLMILVIMFGMGSSLTLKDFHLVLERPRGILIGFCSQFGLMPALAYGLARLLDLPPALAVALVLIGCLPGGSTSNMFAYFARGSVAMSITMTAASTVMALVMMPILLNVYASGFARAVEVSAAMTGRGISFVIPYRNIVVSLLLVLAPVAAGMVLRKVSAGWAKAAEDTASFMGIIVILYLLGTVVIRHGDLFLRTSVPVYLASIGIGVSGFLFGYGLSRVLRLPKRHCRTISLETGIQNGPIAFAIILLSFADPYRNQMLWFAILYSAFIVMTSSVVTLFYRRIGTYDWEVYRNESVHRRLFGNDYISAAPLEPWQDCTSGGQ
jgi:bile acid transporter